MAPHLPQGMPGKPGPWHLRGSMGVGRSGGTWSGNTTNASYNFITWARKLWPATLEDRQKKGQTPHPGLRPLRGG